MTTSSSTLDTFTLAHMRCLPDAGISLQVSADTAYLRASNIMVMAHAGQSGNAIDKEDQAGVSSCQLTHGHGDRG